jgi:hypothetical protein
MGMINEVHSTWFAEKSKEPPEDRALKFRNQKKNFTSPLHRAIIHRNQGLYRIPVECEAFLMTRSLPVTSSYYFSFSFTYYLGKAAWRFADRDTCFTC